MAEVQAELLGVAVTAGRAVSAQVEHGTIMAAAGATHDVVASGMRPAADDTEARPE